MEIIIRRADYTEHSAIFKLLLKWFDELSIEGVPAECGYSVVWLADLIVRHHVIVATIDDKIVGCLGLRSGFFPWNNECSCLFNDFLMTEVNSRGTGVADKLIKAAKQYADDNNYLFIVGHITGTDAKLKDKYLQLKGFQYGGGNFFYKGGQ